MTKSGFNKAAIIAALSIFVNVALLGCCLYLLKEIKRGYHLGALGHANIQLAVLGALEPVMNIG